MSETNGNSSGIHLLTNGRAPMNKSGDLVTRKQVETFVTEFTEAVVLPKMIEIVESYMRQFPELVASMLAMGFAANGLTFKGPSGAEGHTSASAVADASAAPTTAMDAPHAGPSAAATESTPSDAADERAVDP